MEMKGEKEGSSVIEKGPTRRTRTPFPLYPLHFDKKDGWIYTEKNNNTILVHDIREWTKGIESTSIKYVSINKFKYKETPF